MSIDLLIAERIEKAIRETLTQHLGELLKKEENKDEFMTRKETCEFLKCSLNTLDNWTCKGYLKAHRYGTSVRYLKHEVVAGSKNIIRRKRNSYAG